MNIGIIGCGWLGKPLSKHLSQNHNVTCFSRSSTKKSFWENELFIISISTKDKYLQSLQDFKSKIPPSAIIIFTSSTSVYKEFNEEVHEESLITQKSLQKEAEELIQKNKDNVLILRLGGLMGEDRIAGKWKSASSFTDSPVNYIHQEDVLHIITEFISQKVYTGTFNLVAPEHPLRSKVHQKNAKDFGFDLGSYKGKSHTIVNSDKLIKRLKYAFIHPNPLDFWT